MLLHLTFYSSHRYHIWLTKKNHLCKIINMQSSPIRDKEGRPNQPSWNFKVLLVIHCTFPLDITCIKYFFNRNVSFFIEKGYILHNLHACFGLKRGIEIKEETPTHSIIHLLFIWTRIILIFIENLHFFYFIWTQNVLCIIFDKYTYQNSKGSKHYIQGVYSITSFTLYR